MNASTTMMAKTASDLEGSADNLTKTLNTLMTEIEPLQQFFRGAGGTSFQGVKQRFNDDMARLNVALRSLAEAVGSAGTDYTVSDQEIQQDMDKAGATAGQITQALKLN